MNNTLEFKHLIHKDEKKYYIIALLVSIIGYLFLLFSIVGFIAVFFLNILSLFLHGVMMAQIRINGVRLSAQQFPDVFQKTRELCERMEMPVVPEIYVIESAGALNAFATRFFGRNMVVLYSDVFDLINSTDNEELSFIIAHELAHIKRKHITKQMLILPAMWIPFLGEAYSRACEYTCDRIAANYINNTEAAMNGLTMLAIGKSLYKKVNRREYLMQCSQERGFFIWLAEKISTHPPLPKRINAIQVFFYNSSEAAFKKTSKILWPIMGLALAVVTLSGIGFVYADKIKEVATTILSDVSVKEEVPMIIQAVAEGDIPKIETQLDAGIDPNITDLDGWTPLMWAVQDNNVAIINLLVYAGADPNVQDPYEETALILAISQDYVETARTLIGVGADPNLSDSYGWTPLMAAASSENIDLVKVLLEAGADPNSKDEDNFTAFLHAKKLGYKEIADLIKQYENHTK
jgi:Zn-dependent protease with chaperone function